MCNGLRLSLKRSCAFAVAVLAFACAAHAQIGGVQLPRVELPTAVTGPVNGTLGTVRNELGAVQRLSDLRQLRVRELLRTQRQFVERDPDGAPILRAET